MSAQPSKLALQLNKAIASYKAGQFGEAEQICQKIVATKSNFFDAQYVLGVVLASQGKHELALTSYNRALTVQPNHPDALSNRGNTLKELQRFDEAIASYDRALALKPDHVGAINNRAVVLQILQRHEEALASFERALAHQPNYVDALTNRGITLNALGRFDEALAGYDRALALQPGSLPALCNRGNTLRTLQRFDEALACYDRAIALLPNFAEAYANRAILLAQLKRFDEALAAFERLLTLVPNNAEGYHNRGVVLGEMKRYAEAVANYDRALSLVPDYTDAIYNRGNALHELGRYDEALACYDRVLLARPNDGNSFNNRGKVLKELNRYDEAMACSARALAALPDNIVAHCNEASMRLLIGDLPRGFAEYEWRWKKADMAPAKREFPQPLWLGVEDIAGKTIFLHGEQGFGDAIQFCRYATLIAARGARVILEVRPPLVALMGSLAGPSAVIAKGDPLPDFDLHCPLLSLPLAMGTRLETVPAQVPYLGVRPELAAEWGARLGAKTRLRIGLCWSGNATHERDRDRSMRVADFLPLLALDATFVSLHQEVRPDDAAVLAARPDILHFGDALKDFTDTAALIGELDLVISVDTSVAHLAGALGKPIWVTLTYVPEWRWLLTREDSPWYPTARLFRQDEGRAWDGVVARIRDALSGFIQNAH